MKNKKAVCLISGGLDSAVATALVVKNGYEPIFLFLRYGQKTVKKEEWCVNKLKKYYNVRDCFTVNLPWIKEFGGSALLNKDITLDEMNFRLEYVPFRNSIFLSIATALSEVKGADLVVMGSTGGDHICPDNSPQFHDAFQKVISIGTLLKKDIKIFHPLTNTDKVGVVKMGQELKIPFNLTWSCHNNSVKACGHCSNCKSRIKAFEINEIHDPIIYDEK